jgi:hypothetical protein
MEYKESNDEINKEEVKELRIVMSKRINNLQTDYYKRKRKVGIIVNLIFPGLGFWIFEDGKIKGYITFFMYYDYLLVFMFNKIYKLEQPKMVLGLLPLIIINLVSTYILSESDR